MNKENEKKPYHVYVLSNEGVPELKGTKIKLKLKKN